MGSILFAEKGSKSLTIYIIAQNNWVTSYGASKLRNKVIKDTCILMLLDFGDYKIFENAGIQTMIMMFKKDNRTDNYRFDYRRLTVNDECFQNVLDLLNKKPNPRIEYLTPVISRNNYLDRTLTFSDSIIKDILEKIYKQSNFKLYENEIAQGIVCPQDHVIKSTQKILGNQFKIGDGIFVLNNYEKSNIPFTEKELKLIKPYYTTKELGRYYANKNNSEWIIYTDSRFKYPINIKPYPNIKKHLDKFQKVITSDNKPYGLHRARDEKFFKGKKIIAARKCTMPAFTYTDFDCYVSAAFYVIKTEKINLKYLTGLLNSKLIAFWLKHRGKMQGNNYQIDKEPLLALPIIKPTDKEQKKIIGIVNKILSLTQPAYVPRTGRSPHADRSKDYLPAEASAQAGLENPPACATADRQKQAKACLSEDARRQVKEYERQIDQLVYKLYELTDEEIKIVEDFEKNKL
jgi:adenine-specific DNA-methyltransferase